MAAEAEAERLREGRTWTRVREAEARVALAEASRDEARDRADTLQEQLNSRDRKTSCEKQELWWTDAPPDLPLCLHTCAHPAGVYSAARGYPPLVGKCQGVLDRAVEAVL